MTRASGLYLRQGFSLAGVARELNVLLQIPDLYAEQHYAERQQARGLLDQLTCVPGAAPASSAEVRTRLRAADEELYVNLRQGIRAGMLRGASLRQYLEQFTSYRPDHAGA